MSIRDIFKAHITAMAKPADIYESIDQLDEVSDALLGRYSKASREQLKNIASKRGPKSKKDKSTISKREVGVKKAGEISYDRRSAAHDSFSKLSHGAWKAAARTALTDHGYAEQHKGPASSVYTKHDPETNNLFVAKHHFGNPSTRDSHNNHEGSIKMVSSNGTTSSIDHRSFGYFSKHEPEENTPEALHAKHHAAISDELKRHHKWSKDSAFNQNMNEDLEPVTDEMISETYSDEAVIDALIGEAAEEIAAEVAPEKLIEGRGRPRKDGTSAVGADREHIMMQLRKHISLRGINPIEFADGSKHKVSEGHARLAQLVHSQLRTSIEKGNFEKKLDQSHDSFVNALKNKESAGEGKKPHGITLPARDRVARLKFASGE